MGKENMELEKQVTNFELSRALMVFGVKYDSYFSWYEWVDIETRKGTLCVIRTGEYGDGGSYSYFKTKRICSAFTVAELGEILQEGCISGKTTMDGKGYDASNSPCYFCALLKTEADKTNSVIVNGNRYIMGASFYYTQFAGTEANARAKLLIYLLENKLFSL